jgi:hypothetical protein
MGSNRREASKARVLRQISKAVEAESMPLSLCLQFEFGLIETVARQAVGIKEVHHDIRLVTFMNYDLGYFDLETGVLEPLENPFGPRVLPMS